MGKKKDAKKVLRKAARETGGSALERAKAAVAFLQSVGYTVNLTKDGHPVNLGT